MINFALFSSQESILKPLIGVKCKFPQRSHSCERVHAFAGMNGKERIRIHHLGTRGLFADKYSDIRDDSPDEVACKAEGQYPGVGIRMLRGHPD